MSRIHAISLICLCGALWRAVADDRPEKIPLKKQALLREAQQLMSEKEVQAHIREFVSEVFKSAREGHQFIPRSPGAARPDMGAKISITRKPSNVVANEEFHFICSCTFDVSDRDEARWATVTLSRVYTARPDQDFGCGVSLAQRKNEDGSMTARHEIGVTADQGTKCRYLVVAAAYPFHDGEYDGNRLVLLDTAEDVVVVK